MKKEDIVQLLAQNKYFFDDMGEQITVKPSRRINLIINFQNNKIISCSDQVNYGFSKKKQSLSNGIYTFIIGIFILIGLAVFINWNEQKPILTLNAMYYCAVFYSIIGLIILAYSQAKIATIKKKLQLR